MKNEDKSLILVVILSWMLLGAILLLGKLVNLF